MSEKEFSKIPNFESEDEEREFWATHDSTDYVDWSKAERRDFPNLPPTAKATPRGLSMALFREIVEATFRPKTPIVSLEVYLDDPLGDMQRVPVADLTEVKPDSWLFLLYEIEEEPMNRTSTGSVQLLFNSSGQVVEVLGLEVISAPLEREFVDVAKDALSAAIQYCLVDAAN